MVKQEEHFLGVDVGGTHLKIGVVNRKGEIISFFKEDTTPYREDPKGFNHCFTASIGRYVQQFPEIKKVGIGLPGLISKDRTTTLEIASIKDLNGFNLKQALLDLYPSVQFYLENDAAAAALGEYRYGKDPSDNFIFVTMGTGIGSALILDGEVFKGARGNAMEMGHMLSDHHERLEKLIGRDGILKILTRMIGENPDQVGRLKGQQLGTHLLVDTAKEGNQISLKVFEEVGQIMGRAIVSTVRVLDVTDVYFGGGISAGLEFMLPAMQKTLNQYITQYYIKDLKLKKATLENNAGTLGAAALCFMD